MKLVLFVLVAVAVAAAVVLSGARWTGKAHRTIVVAHGPMPLPPSMTGPTQTYTGTQGDRQLEGLGSAIDLEGDLVTPAVATYAVDPAGNLFEVHAPHTEVPHLSAPQG